MTCSHVLSRIRFCSVAVLICIFTAWSQSDTQPQNVWNLANNFYADTLYSLALEQYTAYLDLGSDQANLATAQYRIAECYRRLQQFQQAAAEYERFIELHPRNDRIMDAMYYAGLSHQHNGNYKEATNWFSLVWNRYVGSVTARHALYRAAVCAEKAGEPSRAIQLYDTYLEKFPQDEDTREGVLSLISLLITQKQHAKAIQVIQKARPIVSAEPVYLTRLRYLRAALAYQMQSMDTAAVYFEKMMNTGVREFAQRDTAYRTYISFLSETGQYEKTLTVFALLDSIHSAHGKKPSPSLVFSWAENARNAREFKKAISLYRTILQHYPSHDRKLYIQYRIAECQAAIGSFAQSIETLRKIGASESAGEYKAKALIKIGDMYMEKDLYYNAITVYQRYLQLDDVPDKDIVTYKIGTIYQSQGRYTAAIREYERLVRDYPQSRMLHKAMAGLARCAEKTGDYPTAISHYQYLIEQGAAAPLSEEARKRLSYLTQFKKTSPTAALTSICELLETFIDSSTAPGTLRRLARIYGTRLNHYEKAAAVYQRAVRNARNDSLKAQCIYELGTTYEKISRKYTYEGDDAMADSARREALKRFSSVRTAYTTSPYADDAALRALLLSNPGISEYNAFLDEYPESPHAPAVLFRIARYYEAKADNQGARFSKNAIHAYNRIIDGYPAVDSIEHAYCALAENYLSLHMIDSADRTLSALFTTFPQHEDNPRAVFLTGMIASKTGHNDESLERFKKVLYTHPSSLYARKARYELARVQYSQGRIYEALANYRIYVNDYPDAPHKYSAQLGIARCLAKLGNTQETITLLESLLSYSPPPAFKAEIHFMLARSFLDTGDTTAALRHLNDITESSSAWPLQHAYLVETADFYFHAGIYKKAARHYELLLSTTGSRSDSIVALQGLASSHFMDGAHERARDYMKQFKSRFKDRHEEYASIIFYEGMYFLNGNNYDKARKRFAYILKKYESTEKADDAAYYRALCAYYDDKKDKALTLFEEAIEMYPRSELIPKNRFKIGMIRHFQEKYVQAIDAFEKVVADTAAAATVRFRAAHNAAVDYQRLSSWEKAAGMYIRILDEFPDRLPAWENITKIGFSLFQANKFSDALRYFEKAIEKAGKEHMPELLYWKGLCHQKLGNNNEALSVFLRVPYLYAGSGKWAVTSEFKAAQIYERMNEFGKAKKMYKRVIQSDGESGSFGKRAVERIKQLDSVLSEQSTGTRG